MNLNWEVGHSAGRCAVTGRVLEEGEEFYSAIFEEGETFRRADFSIDAWTGPPENCFCHFKSRIPVKTKKKRLLVDSEMLVSFFTRLAEETEPVRIQFRFVLALILMRKRVLRYERTTTTGGVETWAMVLMTDKSEHQIVNPRLTDDQIASVSQQLGAVLHGDMGEWAVTESAESTSAELGA